MISAQADARSLLALVDIENRRKAREAKEAVDKERFETARAEAISRRKEEAYRAACVGTRRIKYFSTGSI